MRRSKRAIAAPNSLRITRQSSGLATDTSPVSADDDTEDNTVVASVKEVAPRVAPVRGRGRGRGSRGGWRGRDRGQGRGRGSRGGPLRPIRLTAARAHGRGRVRARTAVAAALRRGISIEDEIWDNESRRRSPSPVSLTQPIKDRQEELAALFKKVGQAQQLALGVLAGHSMTKIVYDKLAHRDYHDFVLMEKELAKCERKALNWHRDLYDLKVKTAEKVCVAEVHSITERARVSSSLSVTDLSNRFQEKIGEIKQEMLNAARGKYMELVEGRQAAENDEHTEVSIIQKILQRYELTIPD